MPKEIRISLFIMLTFALLLLVVSCGSDNGGGAERINPVDMVTGIGSNNTGGGGGGTMGATGACVVTVSGISGCYGGIDQGTCNTIASQIGGSTSFTSGQTCQNLGYLTCQSVGGYTVCM